MTTQNKKHQDDNLTKIAETFCVGVWKLSSHFFRTTSYGIKKISLSHKDFWAFFAVILIFSAYITWNSTHLIWLHKINSFIFSANFMNYLAREIPWIFHFLSLPMFVFGIYLYILGTPENKQRKRILICTHLKF